LSGTEGQASFILFTDIYRSTQLWEEYPTEFKELLHRHNVITEETAKANQCNVLKNLGDGYLTVFGQAKQALECTVAVQRGFAKLPALPDGSNILLRVAMHAGIPYRLPEAKEYFGPVLNRCSRICQVCHPGQTLVSKAAQAHIGDTIDGGKLTDLGSHHLRDLAEPERLYQLDHPEFALHEFPPLPTLEHRPNNLVYQPNAFIGRERESENLKALLLEKNQRLITITAPGGYGKSRLATQLCANLLDRYENGVFEVLLAAVGSHERIISATADALGFQFYGKTDPKQQLVDYLREKRMLICFDNFEHVTKGKAILAEILQHAPKVSLLVTSREPLRLKAEKVYRLEPLDHRVGRADQPGEAAAQVSTAYSEKEQELPEAVQLFTDRATLVKHDFTLTEENLALVNTVCERLDGVPLSIELAAAWTDSFTLSELLAEVENQLELTAKMTDVPERHRSIRASLDWSYSLLADEQREVIRAVSTFKGGFFFEAAEFIVRRGLRAAPENGSGLNKAGRRDSALQKNLQKNLRTILTELRDKGWLFTREALGTTRFFIRDAATHQYAREKLQESSAYETVVLAHARYFAKLIEREGEELKGHDQMRTMKALGTELGNIYGALDASLKTEDTELLLSFAKHLASYLDIVSQWQEGIPKYQRIAERAKELEDPVLRMHALLKLARLFWRLSLYDESDMAASAARELAKASGNRKSLALALGNMGNVARDQGRYEKAEKLYQESLQIKREIGDQSGIVMSLQGLGFVAWDQGRYEEAEKLYRESLEIDRGIGNRFGIAESLFGLGLVLCDMGRLDEAEKLHLESLTIERETGDRWGIAASLCSMGIVAFHQTNHEKAQKLVIESLHLFRQIGDRNGISSCLSLLGTICTKLKCIADACRYLREALQMSRDIGARNVGAWALVSSGNLLAKVGHPMESAMFLFGAEKQAKSIGHKLYTVGQHDLDAGMAKLKEALSEEELADAKARGEKMSLEELTEFALKTLEELNL
jgi:predicted ATPase/class 3 adenylate cyclase